MPHRAVYSRFLETADEFAPDLHQAISRLGPLEFPRRNDLPFPEYLCRAISGQQISVKAAQAIWQRVVDSAGERPLIEHFAECEFDTLRACGLSGAKTKTIIGIADAHRTIGLDTDELAAMSASGRKERLTALWGVGPWTVDMMNMFYFGEEDIWPDGDQAARTALERLTSRRRKTVRTAERFRPYRSWLAVYMWAHMDAPPDGDALAPDEGGDKKVDIPR